MTKNKKGGVLRHLAWLRQLGFIETVEIGPGPYLHELIEAIRQRIK